MLKQNRVKRVLAKMDEMGLEQLLVTDAISILYLTDVWVDACERLVALYLNQNGTHRFFVNNMFDVPEDLDVEVVRFFDTDPYLDWLADVIDHEKTLGVDKVMPVRYFLPLIEKNAAPSYVDASVCVDEVRAIKDEEEIEKMRRISKINDISMAEFHDLFVPGVTEQEVSNRMKEIYQRNGADDLSFPPSVCFGANAAVGHYRSGNVPLKKGDCILLDCGCIGDNYCADMTRTFHCGADPDPEFVKVYELVLAANRAAEALIRPGVRLCDIDAAARSIITEGGYGPMFTHRLGHFIGMEVHDYGDVSSANQEVAREGQIFSIEPGVYVSGKFGVRIEDLVLVTKDGCEILNSYNKELEIVG